MQIIIRCRDIASNKARFYALGVQGRLDLGDEAIVAMLVREWGRIGAAGTVRNDGFISAADADAAMTALIERKRRKGYA
jgi:predicted DNA-binding WGR domain protein